MRVEAAGNLLAQDRFVVEQCIKFAHAMPVFLEQYIKFADTRLASESALGKRSTCPCRACPISSSTSTSSSSGDSSSRKGWLVKKARQAGGAKASKGAQGG
eukprot:1155093-Pelagomonas_calceolata.AAC.5